MMKKFIITEEEKTHIRILYEQIDSKDLYSAILGYLDKHGDDITNNSSDKLNVIGIKKEVMLFCEAKRDNQTPKQLSNPAKALFETTSKMVQNSQNIRDYIELGRNIKHTNS